MEEIVQVVTSRNVPDSGKFNRNRALPFNLRIEDFKMAMQDVYDFFYDVNTHFFARGLERLDDTLRPAIMSGLLSDMLTVSLAKHSRTLTQNLYHNGHPDLIVKGKYPKDRAKSAEEGVEIKTTRNKGGAVDMHGARDQWLCVFVYQVDLETEPASERRPMTFTEIYLGHVGANEFRRNDRGELGTRTATLARDGIAKFREQWVYKA
jgi:hypothetical protein